MQHDKFTKKIEQIEKASSTPEEITDNIQLEMIKFGISKVINPLNALKRSGIAVSVILTALIILPFLGKDYKSEHLIKIYDRKAKQNLLFDKSQSRDFDGQIADIPLSFIRYILLSFYERTHYGMTIGGLFKILSQAA